MGGFFGVASKSECIYDLFFGTDYHSHLGTRRAGMAVHGENGFSRAIHNIENAPFRTKFENDVSTMRGRLGIGCISDYEPQPLIVRSKLGRYAIVTVGRINNSSELLELIFNSGSPHFLENSGGEINQTELVSSLIDQRDDFVEGIRFAQSVIDGSMSILILTPDELYAARDSLGRTPVVVGKKEDAYCAALESFSYLNLGYAEHHLLGPGEIVRITAESCETVCPPGEEMRICAFLWGYYGYPSSSYEGVNVEEMRYNCGKHMAQRDAQQANCASASECCSTKFDIIAGVPDTGTAHAIGYANECGVPLSRPFIKYTPTWPRSFTPPDKESRALIARMKLIPVDSLIRDKRILLVDDSIMRGTQLGGTTELLYQCGAKEIHVRAASPPSMFSCKYLNFSRGSSQDDLISRQAIASLAARGVMYPEEDYTNPDTPAYAAMVEEIRSRLGFSSLKYNRLDDMIAAIGVSKDKLCTYCWDGEI